MKPSELRIADYHDGKKTLRRIIRLDADVVWYRRLRPGLVPAMEAPEKSLSRAVFARWAKRELGVLALHEVSLALAVSALRLSPAQRRGLRDVSAGGMASGKVRTSLLSLDLAVLRKNGDALLMELTELGVLAVEAMTTSSRKGD